MIRCLKEAVQKKGETLAPEEYTTDFPQENIVPQPVSKFIEYSKSSKLYNRSRAYRTIDTRIPSNTRVINALGIHLETREEIFKAGGSNPTPTPAIHEFPGFSRKER